MIGVGPIEQPCIKGSNVSMRNINVMTIEYDFLKKKKKLFSIHALFIYLFMISQYMHLYYMNRGNEIKLTLWGLVANEVEESFFTENPSPFIIIATCLTVKTFKGKFISLFYFSL